MNCNFAKSAGLAHPGGQGFRSRVERMKKALQGQGWSLANGVKEEKQYFVWEKN